MNKYNQIGIGLASWLEFEIRAGRESLFCESYLSNPIGQLLQATYKAHVVAEMEHKVLKERHQGAGRKPHFDFGVIGEASELLAAIECKWLSQSKTLARDILIDLVRLRLLYPHYAKEAFLIVAGKMKHFKELFEDKGLQPHPKQWNSHFLLPTENDNGSSIRFIPKARFRESLFQQVLSPFQGLDVPQSIRIERAIPNPRSAVSNTYQVYVWRLKKPMTDDTFKPEAEYNIP